MHCMWDVNVLWTLHADLMLRCKWEVDCGSGTLTSTGADVNIHFKMHADLMLRYRWADVGVGL
jgi:hypothetical protein